jgi:hypothetical protein
MVRDCEENILFDRFAGHFERLYSVDMMRNTRNELELEDSTQEAGIYDQPVLAQLHIV